MTAIDRLADECHGYDLDGNPVRRGRWYLGYVIGKLHPPVLFRADADPTFASHGDLYAAVTGPFRTKRGAVFMQTYGRSNPHCRTVDEAERLGRLYSKRGEG